ncbi:ankyrin repeat domain-containing protein [Aspergillus homomorphus CBS 101889]|uniref:Ankyrin n=1 Tax=Aspergillus homomorphus (strain CBS 101889) TaxID=1450537 RepID=A0A395I9D2_ASPHC|nr:ankyrin [Aspergillus homomorphus CBS 101889]RAL16626.1 ankyrin [Aspergillus homomorphus CBS 101889]
MPLLQLPPELLVIVGEHLTHKSDINNVARTNRYLHSLFEPLLYGRGKQDLTTTTLQLNISHWATLCGNVNTLHKLLRNGALFPSNGLDAKRLGWPSPQYHPIFTAVRKGYLEVVRFFLNQGIASDCRGHQGLPLLHLAAFNNNYPIVEELLQRGEDVSIKDDNGKTIFDSLKTVNMSAVIPTLLQKPDVGNFAMRREIANELEEAIWEWDMEKVNMLVANVPFLDWLLEFDKNPLHIAIAAGNMKIFNLLCDTGALPYDEWVPDYFYSKRTNRYLFGEHTSFNRYTGYKSMYAARKEDIIGTLYKFNLDRPDMTFWAIFGHQSLFCAAYYGHREMAEAVLDRFPELESSIPDAMVIAAFNRCAVTALSHAGCHGWLEQARLLLSAGADITLEDADGKTPIWYAVQARKATVLALYREHSPTAFRAYEVKNGLEPETSMDHNAHNLGLLWNKATMICIWWE